MDPADFALDHIFDEVEYDIEGYKKNQSAYLAKWRGKYEPFIYDYLKQQYGATLNEFWKTYEPPLNSDRAFVIVERRCHPNLWFILRNIAYFGRGWSIYLFCSAQNIKYCSAILGKNAKNVHLKVIFNDMVDTSQGLKEYNELLKQTSFWEKIDTEHLCIFEMDCYLRKHIPDELLHYDYVGTPWAWTIKLPGGTGLTLRKKSVMIDICTRKAPSAVPQDCFAAEGICELGYEFLHPSESKNFFVESFFTEDPVGVHQWWTFFFYNYIVKEYPKDMILKLLTLDCAPINIF